MGEKPYMMSWNLDPLKTSHSQIRRHIREFGFLVFLRFISLLSLFSEICFFSLKE